MALAAARASGADLVGVDLLPDSRGRWTVIELNGAVEFTREYSPAKDVFHEVLVELGRATRERLQSPALVPAAVI